ncbi:ribonuclease T2 protein rnst-2-like [Cotesia glomerata]|uniref:ribonuclease T2 protein rnst-2-like n=1 Tax=Cotesia glomerata TaxID=32391 RepID=UPI001D015474|nr:ribonuclease T2 protein rnst-2-like [Cotesia glomerata]
MEKHWSIHGLWPSVINGEVPDKCHDLTQKFKFSVVHIKLAKDNLYGVLTNNWFNIVDMENPSSGIENFWRTEYDNHGACASHAQSIQDDVGYFRTAIKMLNDMSLATKIRESGLSDGGSILLGTLYDKLTQSIGAKLKIIPAFDKERGNYYLTEIRTCYNLNLRLIDCPNYSGPSKSSRSYSINLFSSVPKLKSPTSSKRFQRLKRDSNVTNVSNVIPTFST